MPVSLYPATVAGRVFAALKWRIEYYAQPQFCSLAVQITDTTPGAVRCPTCWDSVRYLAADPADPTCLGTGWIMPASGSTPQQAGYINPVPFDCCVVPGEDKSQQMLAGIVEYSGANICIWPRTQPLPKKGDVLIVTTPSLMATSRFVFADVQTPESLGFQVFIHTGALELRQRDSPIYLIPPADTTGLEPGTWA